MPSPKDNEQRMERILTAWRTLAPDKSFGGMTLAQFDTACAPARTARQHIDELEDKLTQEIATRDVADAVVAGKTQLVVAGVLADPTEGPDSALIEAFGYTRKSARKTGLTRKRKEAAKK
jgi:hypothetical protein